MMGDQKEKCTCVGNGLIASDCPVHMPESLREKE